MISKDDARAAVTALELSKDYYLGVRRKKVTALDGLNLTVEAGEVFAFLGLNGAGKTTTIKLLLDHARPTVGRCLLFGIDSRLPESRRNVGYMPDLPHFYRFLSAREALDYFGRLNGLSRVERSHSSDRLLELVGLEKAANDRLDGFSRGMLQRVGLAQALLGDPRLLILDEPLGGLDPVGRHEFNRIIQQLKSEGRTIFFSSHILEDAEKIADRVGILHKGKLLACGRPGELMPVQSGWEVEVQTTAPEADSLLARFESKESTGPDGYRIQAGDQAALNELFRLAGEGRIKIQEVNPKRATLEEAFLAEIGKWQH
jgi:ABC-2 type transport system ATP-binding protein